MRGKRTGVVLLAALALAGCGGSSDDEAGLTSGQRTALIQQLEAVRSASAVGNVAETESALNRFRSAVVHLRRTGALDDAQARALRIGAARVLARVRSDNPPPTTPVTTQTTPAPAPAPPEKKKHGKGNGKGEKHGKHDKGDKGGD